jgi:GxxExxY protein
MSDFLFKELTHAIIGVYFDVYNGLGRTYPEFVYEKAMLHDLRHKGISCLRQEEYQVFYKEWLVGLQQLDLFIANEVIVELKAVSHLTARHEAQTFSYLKAFNKQVGLLFNFGGSKPEFKRLFFQPRSSETPLQVVKETVSELPSSLISPALAYEIIGGLYAVHAILGPGFVHRIYGNACYHELKERGLPARPQREIQVIYRNKVVAAVKFAHLQVENVALVFPVAIQNINDVNFNNIKAWLRVQQIPLAILANFHDLSLKPLILKV